MKKDSRKNSTGPFLAKPLSLLRKDSGVLQKAERVFSRTLELKDAVFFSVSVTSPNIYRKDSDIPFRVDCQKRVQKRSLPTFHHSYLFF